MVVPRQMGKAGVRNRIKRIIREVFRKNRSDIKPGTDLVVRMISGKTVLEYHEIERLLLEGIKSTGMVREQLRTRDEATEEK